MTTPVKQERTGWRDNTLSQRHRAYGFNCPAVDLDFLVTEYASGLAVALVEYKAGLTYRVNLEHPSYRAVAQLANGSGIPFAVALYHPTRFAFRVLAGNHHAARFFGRDTLYSELEYVNALYRLRGLALPESVARGLGTWKPTFARGEQS